MSLDSTKIALIAAAALVLAGVALLLGACEKEPRYSGCVIADVSGSTFVSRPVYLDAFEVFATNLGLHGSGDLWVVLAAGDPAADGKPVPTSVAPDTPNDDIIAPAEVQGYVRRAREDLRLVLADPPVKGGGSAIAEATVQCARVLRSGDRLLLLTDGIQNSPLTGDFHTADLAGAGIERLLDELAGADLLPDLAGVSVEAPLLIAHRGGTTISGDRQQQIVNFWRAWARRTGAKGLVT